MGVVEQAKELARLAQDVHNIPLYEKLVSMQADLLDLVDQNATLRGENRRLADALALRDELQLENNVYWRMKDGERTGPYCPRCVHQDGKAVALLSFPRFSESPYACPICLFTMGQTGGALLPRALEQIRETLGASKPKRSH